MSSLARKLSAALAAPLALALWLALAAPLAEARTIRIRMGTSAPKDSPWHDALQYIRQEWREISGGEIKLQIYPGGLLGDEAEMVRQVRAGRIQAVALSSAGLSRIDKGISALQVPMMFATYAELDYVRDRIGPKLEERLEAKGYKLLNWTDGGWVHFFAKHPVRTPDDIRRTKLFTSAGDPETEKLYKDFGFQVIPLSATDMLTSLQTNMINAFDVPPLFAMLDRLYTQAGYMIDLRWAPLVAGTVISKRAWERLPQTYRPQLLAAARAAGTKLRQEIRDLGEDAVGEMKQRGLKVTQLDEAAKTLWRTEAEKIYPKLRGRYAPAELIDEVLRLRNEYREKSSSR